MSEQDANAEDNSEDMARVLKQEYAGADIDVDFSRKLLIKLEAELDETAPPMPKSPRCPECGLDLPADAPLGFCPQCLMKAGMDDTCTVTGDVASRLEKEVGSRPGEPPRQIADYRIVREIGRGGMGIVYEAWEETLKRRVALKILPFHSLMGESHLQRFRREAQAAARLHHTNIVPVFSVGCEHGLHYYAMQYIDGGSLHDLVGELRGLSGLEESDRATAAAKTDSTAARLGISTSGTPLKDPEYFQSIARLALGTASGLQHAHEQGVIHRDIKPSNLILDARGEIWVSDFGLARIQGEPNLTRTGDILGTPCYMSPEQARGKRSLDERTDVYSLGVTLFELLTLSPPFSGDTPAEVLRQVTFKDLRPPRRVNGTIPPDLETIVLKAAEKDPADRYSTAQELADDLSRFLEDKPIRARRASVFQRARKWCRRRKPLVASMVVIVTCLLTVGGLFYLEHRRTSWVEYVDAVNRAVVKLATEGVVLKIGDPFRRPAEIPEDPRDFLGEAMARTDPVQEAIELLEVATEKFPGTPDAHFHLARALELQRRDEEALKALSRCGPDFLPARLFEERLRADGKVDEPSRLVSSLSATPTEAWAIAYVEVMEAGRSKRWRVAEAASGKLLTLIENRDAEPLIGLTLQTRLWRGAARLQMGDFIAALPDFEVASALWPGAVESGISVGWMYYRMGYPERAEERFRRVYSPPRDLDEVARKVSVLYSILAEPEKALDWAEKESESSSREARVAHLLRMLGQLEQAERAARRAIDLDEENYAAYVVLGRILDEQGYPGKAIEQLNRAKPDFAEAWWMKGMALGGLDHNQEALACYDRAIELKPNYAEVWLSKAAALVGLGHHQKALECYDRAIELKPDDVEAWSKKGAVLTNYLRQPEKALQCADRMIELKPDDAQGWSNKGAVLIALYRFQEALECSTRAFELKPDYADAWSNKGAALVGLGNNQEALEFFDRAIELNPDDSKLWSNKGAALVELGEFQEALECYDWAIDLDPEDAETWLNKGLALAKSSQNQEALDCFDRAIELKPDDAKAWSGKGVVLGNLGRFQEGLACSSCALELAPDDANAWSIKGAALAGLGRFPEGLACLDRALELNPDNAGAWRNKGVALFGLGRLEEALACLDRALELNPDDALAWSNKGAALFGLGRLEEALACLDRALELNPDDAGAWSNKGGALVNLGRPQEALECCDRALELDPDDAMAWRNKGMALANLGQSQEALQCYGRALALNPDDAVAWKSKGIRLVEMGHNREALEFLNQAIFLNPDDAVAWSKTGVALVELGQFKDALGCFDQALNLNPDDAVAWGSKGVALASLGQNQDALKCFDRMIELNFDDAWAWWNKGLALGGLRRHQEALECFDRVIKLRPEDAQAWSNKGAALVGLGKDQEAIECYVRAIELKPDDAEAWWKKGAALHSLKRYEDAKPVLEQAAKLGSPQAKQLLKSLGD